MAFIEEDDKLLDNQNQQAQSQGDGSGGEQYVSGQGSAVVGSGQPQASGSGSSARGPGGWTNIQEYLRANNTDTGAGSALQTKVGSEFDKERKNIGDESSKLVSEGQKQVGDLWSTDQVGQKVDSAAKDYMWGMTDAQKNNWQDTYDRTSNYRINQGRGTADEEAAKMGWGPQKDSYTGTVKEVQDYLGKQYTGPRDYTYGIGNTAQGYGAAMGDDASFDQFMGDLYSERAKAPLNSGQRSLQTQLNLSNDALNSARQNILKDYAGLNEYRDKTAKETTDTLSGLESSLRTNQNQTRDYLNQRMAGFDTAQQQKEADKRKQLLEGAQERTRDYAGAPYIDPFSSSSGAINFGANRDLTRNERQGFNTIADFLGGSVAKKDRMYDITNGGIYDATGKNYTDLQKDLIWG